MEFHACAKVSVTNPLDLTTECSSNNFLKSYEIKRSLNFQKFFLCEPLYGQRQYNAMIDCTKCRLLNDGGNQCNPKPLLGYTRSFYKQQ